MQLEVSKWLLIGETEQINDVSNVSGMVNDLRVEANSGS
jgi:hypothetical protein